MIKTTLQLDLFHQISLNTTYETKRAMRLAVLKSHLSREEIVDQINKVAVQEGMRTTISKATLDNWLKDSDQGRMPSPAWLTIFCYVLQDARPIGAMLNPLGYIALGGDTQKLLAWAEAEIGRRKASKKARIALANLEEA
jgi:hypothetical protein